MRFGTSVHALTDWSAEVKPLREVLRQAAELGFEGIMLMHLPGQAPLTTNGEPQGAMIDMEASDRDLVRGAVEEAGLEVWALYEGAMRVADEKETSESARDLARLAQMARELGCAIVLPNAGVAPRPLMPPEEKAALIERVADVVRRVLDAAPPEVRIAPDVHYGGVIETVADCERVFELVPDSRAGITLNIGHMTTLRQEGWRLLEEWPERVHAVAWKDHLLQPPAGHDHAVYSVELGTGDSPFERYARLISADGGPHTHLITFEHVPPADKPAALGRSLEYMRGLWARTH